MRIHFPDLVRPKQAAKQLARITAKLKLATVQEALARALAYRDWHELSIAAQPNSLATTEHVSLDDALRIILELADALALPDADVQYAVSRSRLLRATPWSLDDHMFLRRTIWRQRAFGSPGRGKPGTVARDKAYGSNTPAYLRYPGRPPICFSTRDSANGPTSRLSPHVRRSRTSFRRAFGYPTAFGL